MEWWQKRSHAGDAIVPRSFMFTEGGAGEGGAGGGAGAGAGDAGEGGTTGDDDTGGESFTPPDLKSPAAKKWFEDQTAGLSKKNRELLDKQTKTQKELRDLKDKLAPLGDLDKAGEFFKHAKTEEERKLLSDGKFEEVINRRSADARKPLELELTTLKQQDSANRERIASLTIDQVAADEATRAGVHKESLKVVKMLAREVFKVGDDYTVTAKDSDGMTVLGKDGKPLTPATWIEKLREEHPYLFPGSSGGGATGGPTKGGGKVIRLAAGYSQAEFNAAMDKVEKEGAKLVMPGAKE
jgi:hypothetical protein